MSDEAEKLRNEIAKLRKIVSDESKERQSRWQANPSNYTAARMHQARDTEILFQMTPCPQCSEIECVCGFCLSWEELNMPKFAYDAKDYLALTSNSEDVLGDDEIATIKEAVISGDCSGICTWLRDLAEGDGTPHESRFAVILLAMLEDRHAKG